jgi:hypothetical protein
VDRSPVLNANGSAPEPGGRQAGEPDRAWAAFVAYRDLDPAVRSLNRSRTEPGPGSSLSELKRWSSRWRWRERVATWDAHVDATRRKAAEGVHAERGRTGAELAARVRGVLAEILDRPNLDSADVLRAARTLRELALAVPESAVEQMAPPPPFLRHPDPPEIVMTVEEEGEHFRSVLAILEEAGVVALPEWSAEPGRQGRLAPSRVVPAAASRTDRPSGDEPVAG